MQIIAYSSPKCNDVFNTSNSAFRFAIQKPRFCPVCRLPQEGKQVDFKLWSLGGTQYYGTVMYECTSCGKQYLVTYNIDLSDSSGVFGAFHPPVASSYDNEILKVTSPRFIEIYNQALHSEDVGDFDIAAIGFRLALECLVKDYAIKHLNKPTEEVSKKTLADAIGDYLETDLVKAADVVRILGNDYAHYERKHADLDYALLKRYLNIFIQLVETKVMLANPPVSR